MPDEKDKKIVVVVNETDRLSTIDTLATTVLNLSRALCCTPSVTIQNCSIENMSDAPAIAIEAETHKTKTEYPE